MVAKLFSSNQYKWGDIIIIKIEDGIRYLKLNFFVLYIWYIKNNLIETNKYKKKYFKRNQKQRHAKYNPTRRFICFEAFPSKIYISPNGNWETLTLNSGVVKL